MIKKLLPVVLPKTLLKRSEYENLFDEMKSSGIDVLPLDFISDFLFVEKGMILTSRGGSDLKKFVKEGSVVVFRSQILRQIVRDWIAKLEEYREVEKDLDKNKKEMKALAEKLSEEGKKAAEIREDRELKKLKAREEFLKKELAKRKAAVYRYSPPPKLSAFFDALDVAFTTDIVKNFDIEPIAGIYAGEFSNMFILKNYGLKRSFEAIESGLEKAKRAFELADSERSDENAAIKFLVETAKENTGSGYLSVLHADKLLDPHIAEALKIEENLMEVPNEENGERKREKVLAPARPSLVASLMVSGAFGTDAIEIVDESGDLVIAKSSLSPVVKETEEYRRETGGMASVTKKFWERRIGIWNSVEKEFQILK